MSLKCIYLKGWIRSGVSDPKVSKNWEDSAKDAEIQNSELVVFRIPKGKKLFEMAATIGEIEQLLQNKYPDI